MCLKKVIMISESWSHMSSVSGFSPFLNAVVNNKNIEIELINREDFEFNPKRFTSYKYLIDQMRFKLFRDLKYGFKGFYSRAHHRIVLYLNRQSKSINNKDCLVIFTVAENQFPVYVPSIFKVNPSKVVLVFHQPPAWLKLNNFNAGKFDAYGRLICLGGEQLSFFKESGLSNLIKIFHGVDLTFFSLPKIATLNTAPNLNILFVGAWLRDFDALYLVMKRCFECYPNTQLTCVLPGDHSSNYNLLKLSSLSNVRIFSGISPESLRDMYSRADLLFLPLISSVANNAIVESLSCGLPIVTNIGSGASDYIPFDAGILCDIDDPDSVINTFWFIKNNRNKFSGGRKFAETNLNWNSIVDQLFLDLQKNIS